VRFFNPSETVACRLSSIPFIMGRVHWGDGSGPSLPALARQVGVACESQCATFSE
jgi:hypothetical protein